MVYSKYFLCYKLLKDKKSSLNMLISVWYNLTIQNYFSKVGRTKN